MDPGPKVVYEFGPFRADPHKLLLLRDDQPVPISRKVFEALLILVRHRGEVVTKQDLMTELWPDAFVEESNLSQTIFMLRKALGETPEDRRYIVTLPGRGYRFAADVRAINLDGEYLLIASRTRAQVLVEHTESEIGTSAKALPATARPGTWWKYLVPIGAFAALLAGGIVILPRWHRPVVLGEKGAVVVADFANSTGDPVFDDTLRQGLIVQLEQSPYLVLTPEQRIQHTLTLMGQQAGARITPELAREVCERVGRAAVLDGSIVRLGTQYVVGLSAKGCQNGDFIDEEQAQAARKEDVLNALTQIASKLRRRLGESLETIKEHNTPLAETTTPSIEALNDYSKAWRINSLTGGVSAIPLLKRAIEIDPKFAMAYAFLGRVYGDLGETTLSAESATRAYQLRDRVSGPENFFIAATYERQVTGNLEKARETLGLWIQTYPRDQVPWSLLSGGPSLEIGEFEKSAEAAQKALELDPDQSFPYTNLAISDVALGRMAQAKDALQQAAQRKLESQDVLAGKYHIAFLEGNHPEMERVVAESKGKPGIEDCIADEEAHALAYSGHLQQARRMSSHAVNMAMQMDDRERSAEYQMETAVREAFLGNVVEAKRSATVALTFSKARDVEYGAAFALARSGNWSLAEALANDLDKRFPEDTLVRFNYLPTLRALLALDNGSPSKAVELLQATGPYEMGFSADSAVFFGALYPVYVRGEAYLVEHRGAEAAAEFQKIIGHRGIVLSDPIGALALLQWAGHTALRETFRRRVPVTRISWSCGRMPILTFRS